MLTDTLFFMPQKTVKWKQVKCLCMEEKFNDMNYTQKINY